MRKRKNKTDSIINNDFDLLLIRFIHRNNARKKYSKKVKELINSLLNSPVIV
jgi:hypothetical protein